MAMGIPVVVPSNSNFYTYPNDINRIAHTKSEFVKMIREAVSEGWSLENSRKAFRWYGFLFDRVSVGFSETYTSRPTALRPKKPGLKLWLWKKMVYIVLQYGPLVRERIALKRPPLPATSIQKFADVLDHKLDTVSDSSLWNKPASSLKEETAYLRSFFEELTTHQWSDVNETNSLAGRVRAALKS